MAETDPRPPITLALSPETATRARITDGVHAIDVTKQGDSLLLHVSTNEQSSFSVALLADGRTHLVFDPRLNTLGITPADYLPQTQLRPATSEAETTPEKETVTLTGNIGRTPTYRPHKKSGLVYTFPLGVHPEKGVTTWYDVLVPDELAKTVQASFEKGQKVTITGIDNTHTEARKDGEEKLVRHFHATEVKKATAKPRT